MRPFSLSNRLPGDFTPNEMSRRLEELKRSGRKILDLTVSNPTAVGFSISDAELGAAFASDGLGTYDPHPRGLISARQEISQWLKRSGHVVDPDHLWLTSGSSEAYSFLFRLLANPGDEFLIPTPSYPLFEHLLKLDGLSAGTFPLYFHRSWKVDFDALSKKVGPRTKGVIVVHPNNPTGSFLSDTEIQKLAEFCSFKRIALIVDEVFLSYPWDGRPRPSFHSVRADCPVFVVNGLSKHFGLPQLKLSWIHANVPKEMFTWVADGLDWISDSYLSVSAPVQRGIGKILGLGDTLHERIFCRVRTNMKQLKAAIHAHTEISDVSGEGGWNAVLELSDVIDEERFATTTLDREDVVVQPGYLFDLPFDCSIVLSLLTPEEIFSQGVDVLIREIKLES